MPEWLIEQALLFTVAVTANLLSALAGGGAGLLQLPALIFLGLPFVTALATHKIATVALGIGAGLKHSRAGHWDTRFALFILACGLPGVVAGSRAALDLPEQAALTALGVLTLGLSIHSMRQPQLGQSYQPRHRDRKGFLLGGLLLLLLGFLNGALASGTGLFVTLWLIHWFGLDYKRATGYTMILVGLFWNGAGAITLTWLAAPQWHWLPALLAGSLIGGYWGAHLAIRKGNPLIKRLFETVTFLTGVSLIASAVMPN